MPVAPVDLVGLVATIMGISVILIPVIGLTARFALKPTVEALGKFFETKGSEEIVRLLERRVALLEQQVEYMEGHIRELEDVSTFHRELGSGTDAGSAAPAAPAPHRATHPSGGATS
jgi:hypothetical protein